MLYILLNIVLSSFFILCLKWLHGRDEDTITVGAINYIAAGLVGGVSFFAAESRALTFDCQPEEQQGYVFITFALTAAASIILLLLRRRRPTGVEMLVGTTLGLTNAYQTLFLLKALESLPGFIVFPATSAGGLVFTMLVAVVLLNERLSRLSYIGIAMGATSLALLKPDG